ncbi:hypothetical protein [Nocardia jejuensis]|uniref:hypothetical protein n=1 Tax=Nocardia jejuensis TaxID=328049 RepID=UPI00082BB315|nr:hypothetical protein [Nocardia jejuensis]
MSLQKQALRTGLATLTLAAAITAAAGPAYAEITLESPAETAADVGSSTGSLDPAVGSSTSDSGSAALIKILEPSGHGLSSVEDMLPAALRIPVAEAFAKFLISLSSGSTSPCTTNCTGGQLP